MENVCELQCLSHAAFYLDSDLGHSSLVYSNEFFFSYLMLCVIVLGIQSLSCMHICGLMKYVLLNDLTVLVLSVPFMAKKKNPPVLSATKPRL